MKTIEEAVKLFNEEKYSDAELIALEYFFSNVDINNSLDILAAIYLRTEELNFLKKITNKHLPLIRQLASFLEKLQMYQQAAFFYKKSLEIEPNDTVALNNLGLISESLENTDDALSYYNKALKISDNYPALYNLGVLYRKLKKLDLSEKYLKKALELKPTDKYANYSLGMTYFMNKNFENGYKYFLKRPVQGIEYLQNAWSGDAQSDNTILVYCEYGLGDAIMFSRYFPTLKNYFKHIKVCVKQNLITLFQKSFPDIEFVTSINTEYDFSILSMNLPYYLKLDFDNIPNPEGYLKTDENLVQKYKQKYFDNDNLKIGIFYVGGELEKRNARYRSIELKNLEKIFSIPNSKIYSFQKEDIFEKLNDYPEIIDLGKTFNDFSDTAAAMKNLDILLTIDSAPVHLAGAIGVRTFLMLPFYSEWRWFTDDIITPWYNSVEIIKQTAPCDWQNVTERIYNKLLTNA